MNHFNFAFAKRIIRARHPLLTVKVEEVLPFLKPFARCFRKSSSNDEETLNLVNEDGLKDSGKNQP